QPPDGGDPMRFAAVLTLVLLAPFTGELLLGNLPAGPAGWAVMLIPLILLYGGGALLIREGARRLGRGGPTVLRPALPAGPVGGAPMRFAAVLTLVLLAPFTGELLLGTLPAGPAGWAVMLIPLILLYGGGALLIREVARRLGRGYPTMLLLAIAYGLIEEGF